MPSVGMRRSTRVFGTRVLRSGRRLLTEPHEGNKNVRAAHGENKWTNLLDNSADGGGNAADSFKQLRQENEDSAPMDMSVEPTIEEPSSEVSANLKNGDRMHGLVYRRKRKRLEPGSTSLPEDKRYGKKFVRERWRRKCGATQSFETGGKSGDSVSRCRELAVLVNGPSYDCGYWVTRFLASVLSYMTRFRVGMRRMSAFVLSRPIFNAFSAHGVLFIQGFTIAKDHGAKKPGICIISGSRSSIPIFYVNFSAIPSVFVHMQRSLFLRSGHLACLFVAHSLGEYDEDEKLTNMGDNQDCFMVESQDSPGRDISDSDMVASANDSSGRIELSHSAVGSRKSTLRNLQLRNSRNIQKRRSNLRRKRGRPPSSHFRAQRANGTLASEFFRIKHDSGQFSSVVPNRVLRSSDKSSTSNTKTLKSILRGPTQDVRVSSCSANLLVIETDKCYREEGATITLELSASKKWFLVVKKDGAKRYSLAAQRVMRPSGSNRISHDTIWTSDDGWKLEFPNKQDWLVFKELYKECSERNIQSSAASVIPVPRVEEVSMTVDSDFKPFVRPDSYITVKDDELVRTLVNKSANYDMDSDDEEWLEKLNEDLYGGREMEELVSPESFELIIDAHEKGFYSNPDENFDEQAPCDFCVHLERREVVEAIHKYWMKKRKQKRTSLSRIFQLYQPRRIQVIPKTVLRKKRSFKRQPSQTGRGKYRPMLPAIAAERDAHALENNNNTQKLQEAKAAADRFEEMAILKRQRAQMLMENADLVTYKAVLALRIAEAAQLDENRAS